MWSGILEQVAEQRARIADGLAGVRHLVAVGSGNAALIAAVPPGSEGGVRVRGDNWGYGWNVGADIALLDNTLRVALSHRSAVRHSLRGDVRFDARPAALDTVLPDGPVRASVRLPATTSLAAAWDTTPQLQLRADVTRQPSSAARMNP